MPEKLYCPRCATQSSSETSFCRKCGLALDGVSEIVTGEAANAPVMTSRPNFKVIRLGFGLFIFGMVIGLLNGAIRELDLFPQSYGKVIFLTMIAVGMLTMGLGIVFPTKKYTKRKPSKSTAQSESAIAADTSPLARQLNSPGPSANDFDFPKREFESVTVGSVTEPTTRNLDNQLD